MSTPGPSRSRVLLAALALSVSFALPACVVPKEKIEGEDRGVFLPSARCSVDLLREPAASTAPARPRGRDFRLLLDLDVGYGQGEFTQHVGPGQVVSLGGPQFTGDVDVEFSLLRALVDVRAVNRWENGLGLDGFVGIGVGDLDVELSQGALSDSENYTSYGPVIGGAASLRTWDALRIYVEASFGYGVASGVEWIGTRTLDVGAELALGRQASLAAGWRQLVYEAELDDFVASDMELELSGPFLALRLVY
jgi:hypothetical protein